MTGEMAVQVGMAAVGALGFGLLFHISGSRLVTILLGGAANWGFTCSPCGLMRTASPRFCRRARDSRLGGGIGAPAQNAGPDAAGADARAARPGRRPVL